MLSLHLEIARLCLESADSIAVDIERLAAQS